MDGIILVNKPQNFTSHDIVLKIRGLLQVSKVGHFGTLDPMATGLLILSVGKATRLFPFYSKTDKTYTGIIQLGFSTDTYDAEGKKTSEETHDFPDKETVLKAIKSFEGEMLQTPPPYSAKKYHGKPYYALARAQKEFPLKPVKKTVYHFISTRYSPPDIHFEVKCSSGTYIRSLAHDLGQKLGCGAHLSQLVRTGSGAFSIKNSLTPESIGSLLAAEKKTEAFLLPLESLLPEYSKIILNEHGSIQARNGNVIFPENILDIIEENRSTVDDQDRNTFRLFNDKDQIIAFAKRTKNDAGYHPFLVLSTRG